MNQQTPLLNNSPSKEHIGCNGSLPNNCKKKNKFRYAFWSLINDLQLSRKGNKEQTFIDSFVEIGKLFKKTKRMNDIALIFAAVGFILMLVDMENFINGVYIRNHTLSGIIKGLNMTSTLILLIFLYKYHR